VDEKLLSCAPVRTIIDGTPFSCTICCSSPCRQYSIGCAVDRGAGAALQKRSMLLCESQEDNEGNMTLLLVLVESEMRAAVLLNSQRHHLQHCSLRAVVPDAPRA
jgi:hypothetical protein